MRPYIFTILSALLFVSSCSSVVRVPPPPIKTTIPNPYNVDIDAINKVKKAKLLTGAEQTALYVPLLKGKRVGMVLTQTSIISRKHSVDSLRTLGINIVK